MLNVLFGNRQRAFVLLKIFNVNLDPLSHKLVLVQGFIRSRGFAKYNLLVVRYLFFFRPLAMKLSAFIGLLLALPALQEVDMGHENKLSFCSFLINRRIYKQERLDVFCTLKVQEWDNQVRLFARFLIAQSPKYLKDFDRRCNFLLAIKICLKQK